MTTPSGLLLATLLVLALAIAIGRAFRRDMETARRRLRARSVVWTSPWGEIEYAEGGRGADVLIVHAAGGGWDQGALIAEALLDERFHWIAPSRFGYLRSSARDAATAEEQAHAYAALLDHLGIERVAVVAMSAGGPSALLFAILHPHRLSSLTLISCSVAGTTGHGQEQAGAKGNALVRVFRSDLRLWLMTRLFRGPLLELMGMSAAAMAAIDSTQRVWIDRVLAAMHPASLRYAGVLLDNRGAPPGERIRAIEAPALIFHAKDDTLQPHAHAEFAEANIPRALLVSFARGGHLLLVAEQDTLRLGTQRHILDALQEHSHGTAPSTAA